LLIAASRAYHKHLQLQPDDPEVRRQAARVFRYAGNIHRLEGEYPAAEALHREAVGLLEGLADQIPDEPAYRLQLSETLRDRAKVQSRLGRLGEAVAALDRVAELAGRVLAADPNDAWNRRALAGGLLQRSAAQHTRGKQSEAGVDAQRAADLFEALERVPADAHPYDPLLRAAAVNLLALVERESGRAAKAEELHRTAVALAEPLAKGARAGVNRSDAEHFQMMFRLEQGRTWLGTGKRAGAEKNFGLLAGRWQQMAKDQPRVPDYREAAGIAFAERGRVRAEDGRRAEALADFEAARGILEAEVRRAPDVPELSGDLGRTYAGLARLARGGGDSAAAADWFGKALAVLRSDIERAPERARDVRDLREIEAEAAR
jgi:tetratricopeptide (TPR) repeat protein